ncbi:MAG: hypothetical protein WD065_08095 [Planctomycetaceae bacterium]
MTNNPAEPPAVDMSPEAIDQRFRMVEALRKLCVSLKEAGERGAIDASRETERDGAIRRRT